MRFIHTADLHLGQVIYQNYDRCDEHRHFFRQLLAWCVNYRPDALLLSGDIFDIQQPSAATRKVFCDFFVELHRACSDMAIIITAGNHDSASRLQADSAIWQLANTTLLGTAPSLQPAEGWEQKYIVRLPSGYIIAMPYMACERKEMLQHLLDLVAEQNVGSLPVVMMGHTAVDGLDCTGHATEIGQLKTLSADSFGCGYDYLALGHIHKPQTLGHHQDNLRAEVSYPAPVLRYSGSALHVSCDEDYPHTVSLVDIDRHGGEVRIEQLRIDELRHFYTLPEDGSSFTDAEQALLAVDHFCHREGAAGYIRLRMDCQVDLPADFNQLIYQRLAETANEVRYNPKVIWTGAAAKDEAESQPRKFEVADIQQMTNPLQFIEQTIDRYPSLSLDEIREAFQQVEQEILRMQEEGGAL